MFVTKWCISIVFLYKYWFFVFFALCIISQIFPGKYTSFWRCFNRIWKWFRSILWPLYALSSSWVDLSVFMDQSWRVCGFLDVHTVNSGVFFFIPYSQHNTKHTYKYVWRINFCDKSYEQYEPSPKHHVHNMFSLL